MLTHLVYASVAARQLCHDELTGLLEQARTRNAHNRITGMLLYKDGRFIQLLEGDEGRVTTTYQAILTDDRHENVQVLWHQYVQFRDFPDWTMGFADVSSSDTPDLQGYTRFLDRDLRYESYFENSTDTHAMLHAFRENPRVFP